jgi:hypothetical protein
MPLSFLLAVAMAAVPPVCASASHDRLVVQPGRDVCGASLNQRGEPRASGFLPTACADDRQRYRVDARGNADLCVAARAGAAA